MKINATEKALIEHYSYGVLAAGYATYSFPGRIHTIKEIILGGLIGGLLVPILAKVNPKSLVNTISKDTGAPAPLVEAGVDAALKAADKIVAENTPKA